MGFKIRRASQADVPNLAVLYLDNHRFQTSLVPELLCQPSAEWTTAGLASALHGMLQNPVIAVFVATSNGVIVGLVDVVVVDQPESEGTVRRRYAKVDNLIVASARRSGGVGSRLMAEAEEWARSRDAGQLEVKIWDRPGGPIRFYESTGYTTISRLMVKALR